MAELEELPVDAWLVVSGCLSGADLVHLLHVSKWSRQLFSQDDFWLERLTPDDDASGEENRAHACQAYLRSAFSFEFDGLPVDPHTLHRKSSAVARINDSNNIIINPHNPLSFDLWFCLLEGGDDDDGERCVRYSGGILFGTQSTAAETRCPWRNNHQLAYVDPDKSLFCSVVNEKPEIASNLELNRWYHLALTYANQTQRVYLDGQLKSALEGRLHEGWYLLKYLQVGTGLLLSREQRLPVLDYCGWYPFNGLIDNFRIWSQELSSEGVQSLKLGSARDVQGRPVYELKRDLDHTSSPPAPQRHPPRVGCTRPNEKVVEPFRIGKCTPKTSEDAPPAHQRNRLFRSVKRAFKRFTKRDS